MLAVVVLGGGALLRQDPRVTDDALRDTVRVAARAIAPVAAEHQIVIAYGGAARHEATIAYMIEQELANLLPVDRPFAAILTRVEVDPPPQPKRTFELRPIKWLLERNTLVIATGGGIPVMYERGEDRRLTTVQCAIDMDLASELLAGELGADVFVMLTDVDAVYANWGSPAQTAIRKASPASLKPFVFDASIGSKVNAACRFATATGKRAAIGALDDLNRIIAGDAGTTISSREAGIVYAPPVRTIAQGSQT